MSFGNRHTTRALAGGAAGLLGLTFLPGSAGAAISTQAFCANVPTGQSGFTDIAQAGVHARNVECLKGAGVTAGTTPTTYSPTANVTRGQMATFIANMIDRANQLDVAGAPDIPDLPTAGASADAFTDDEGNIHENNINRLAQANIVNGTSATTFSPDANVSRAQMASFIAQALGFVRGGALPEGADAFTDDETSVHEANINRLATADIVDGTGPNTYNPNGLVSRAQMASFIVQAMADLHADGFITPIPAGSQATLNISPTTAQQVERANDDGANVGTDDRTYTVTGLAAGTYRITLFQSSNVSSGGGQVTFADAGPNDNVADQGTPVGQILTVNGTGQALNTTTVGGVQPVNGTITFTVDADGVNGSDTPVIFADGGATTNLDLDANDRPTEAFGVGGAFIAVPAEGPIGPIAGTVVIANPAGDSFTTATATYNYDANDTFQFQAVGITQAQFEAILSTGDTVAGAYNPDPAGTSTFNITVDTVAAPTNVQATVANTDADPTANDVSVTFTPASGAAAGTTYQLQRAPVDDGADNVCGAGGDDVAGAFANVGSPGSGSPLADNDVANGCYAYRVIAINPTSNAQSGPSGASNAVAVPPVADTDDPDALDTKTTNAAGLGNTFQEAGDAFAICFDEVLADVADADVEQLQLTDDDGTIVTLNNTNATFARNAAVLTSVEDGVGPAGCAVNQALTVTLTAAPIVTAPGGTAGLTLVGTTDITDAGGIQDTAGVTFSPAGDTDVTVDNA